VNDLTNYKTFIYILTEYYWGFINLGHVMSYFRRVFNG